MLDTFFTHILDMSITGSIVIVVVLLARLGLRRMPKAFSYCLWSVVLLRLLCPAGISLPVASVKQVPSVTENYTLSDVEVPFWDAGAAAVDGFFHVTNRNPNNNYVEIPTISTQQENTGSTIVCSPWETWVLFGQYLWAAGAAVLMGIGLLRLRTLRKKLAEAVHLQENIYLADGIATPFVMGLLRPRIYVPAGLTQQELQHILLHERHHVRRLDPLWKLLGYGALSLHWFNPLVWVAFRLAVQDMEMSCDEAVIKRLGSDVRADYSQSLLRFSIGRSAIAGVPLSFGEGDAGKRIRNLSRWKQPRRAVALVTAMACALLIAGCAVDSTQQLPTSNNSNPTVNQPSTVPDTVFDNDAELFFCTKDESFNGQKEQAFTLPEYPGVQFLRSGGNISVLENGQWRSIFSAHTIYLADLNGDGKREFCGVYCVGSGIMDQRIGVYDYVEDMRYCLQERGVYDYDLQLDGKQLVACRYRYRNGPDYDRDTEIRGRLVLQDRILSFISDQVTVLGSRSSVLFNDQALESILEKVRDYHNRGIYLRILPGTAADYYMEHSGNDFSPALFTEAVDGSLWLDPALAQDFAAEARYLELLHRLTSPYYASELLYFVYQDPSDPAQLFICTEIRDCGYRDIAQYYQAVKEGRCQPHAETFLVRLDSRAIYRWGENDNLYQD